MYGKPKARLDWPDLGKGGCVTPSTKLGELMGLFIIVIGLLVHRIGRSCRSNKVYGASVGGVRVVLGLWRSLVIWFYSSLFTWRGECSQHVLRRRVNWGRGRWEH